jgi:hypothetical protein
MIAGALAVKRRLAPAVHDGVLDRRASLWLIGGLAVLAIVSSLNSLPSELYSYDTAEPWSTFVGTTALGFLAPVVLTLVLVALLRVLDALRRRVGIPMLPAGPWRSARADVLIMGLGLGGVIYAAINLDALLPPSGMPATPSTNLNDVFPLLAGIPDIPAGAIGAMVTAGIPILVVAGLTSNWRWRALVTLTILALVAAISWSFEDVGDVDPAGLALLLASIGVIIVAIRAWGPRSAWSWIIAALSYDGLGGLRDAVYGSEWQARGSGALTLLVAAALIALIWRRAGLIPT